MGYFVYVCTLSSDVDVLKRYKLEKGHLNYELYEDLSSNFLKRCYNLPIKVLEKMYPMFKFFKYRGLYAIPDHMYRSLGTIIIEFEPKRDMVAIENFLWNLYPMI